MICKVKIFIIYLEKDPHLVENIPVHSYCKQIVSDEDVIRKAMTLA